MLDQGHVESIKEQFGDGPDPSNCWLGSSAVEMLGPELSKFFFFEIDMPFSSHFETKREEQASWAWHPRRELGREI
jgi:hypothetical protein